MPTLRFIYSTLNPTLYRNKSREIRNLLLKNPFYVLLQLLCVFAMFDVGSRVYAERQWRDVRQLGTWKFHANFSLSGYGTLLKDVGKLQLEVPRQLGIRQSDQPVEFYLLRRKNDYRSYVKTHFPSLPYRPALFIKQSGKAMVFAHLGKQFAIDLRHEATHAVLHSSLPIVPLWLDEGLAEYFEQPRELRVLGNPYLQVVTKPHRKILAIEELESLDDFSKMKKVHYQDSWAWTHYLLHGPKPVRDELRFFLRSLQVHSVPDPLSQRLSGVAPSIESKLQTHLAAMNQHRTSNDARPVSFRRLRPMLKNLPLASGWSER